MNIIIYGLGKRFWNNKEYIYELSKEDNIVAYADKSVHCLAKIDTQKAIQPDEINKKNYDYIVVTAVDYRSIKQNLMQQGIAEKKIITLNDYEKIKNQGSFSIYPVKFSKADKRIIIGINDLGLHGGTMACFYMACELQKRGYGVDVAAYRCTDKNLIQLFNKNNIGIKIFKSYPYIGGEDKLIFDGYDYVIGNTVATIAFVGMVHNTIPTLWWIHEAEDLDRKNAYEEALEVCLAYDINWINNIHILAVSSKAKIAFINSFKYSKVRVLPLGIKDERVAANKTNKIIFAVIGYIREDKNQLQFLEAYEKIYNEKTRCLIIGKNISQEKYKKEINKIIKENSSITELYEIQRDKLLDLYSEIDIVVCPSLLESMSLTIIEGMMNSKICITTDNTGIAEYIEDGVNGFICKAGDVDSLRDKMQYVINHFDELDDMRKKARQTYEKYFTLEVLGENLEREINIAVEDFNKRHAK